MEHRRGRRTLRLRFRRVLTLHSPAAERDRHEFTIRRQQHRRGIVARILQHRAAHMILSEVTHRPVGHHELVTTLIVDDRLITHSRDRQGADRLETLHHLRLRAPRLSLALRRHQRRGPRRVREHPARARHRHNTVAHVVGNRALARERHRRGFTGVTHPQETLIRIQNRQHRTALHLHGTFRQGHRLTNRKGRRTYRRYRARARLPERHVTASLPNIEGCRLNGHRAIEHPGVVIQMAHELAILIGHPDTAIIDADLRDLHASGHERNRAQDRRHEQDGNGRQSLGPDPSRLVPLLHVTSSVSMACSIRCRSSIRRHRSEFPRIHTG